MRKIFILFLSLSAVLQADLPPPYDKVDLLPFNPHGWYQNGDSLEPLIKNNHVKVIIEVGSWLGASTRHIAKTLPEDGIVYAVDHWMGSPNEDNSPYDIANLYQQFLSNVIHENLTHKIVPLRMSSLEAASTLKIRPDLIYIDATHDYENVRADLIHWFPFVKGHGILCGDDYNWGEDLSVKRAVDTFALENNLTVHTNGWFWRLEEVASLQNTPLFRHAIPIKTSPIESGIQGIDCIYVINLDERPERWERMKALCEELGLHVNRVSAVNGWNLSREVVKDLFGPYTERSTQIRGGPIGCMMSHLSVIRDAYEKGYNCVWILEDDAAFLEDIHEIPELISELTAYDPQWDILFTDQNFRNENGYTPFYGLDPRPHQPLEHLSYYSERKKISDHLMQIHSRYATTSILWSRKGLEKATHFYSTHYMWTAIDIDMHTIPGLREYASTSDIVSNLRVGFESDGAWESSLNPNRDKPRY